MKRAIFSLLLSATIFPVASFAADYDLAKSNVAGELAMCTAYFYQVADCLGNTEGQAELAVRYQSLAGTAHMRSIGASNEDVANSRFMLYADEMQKEIKNHCSNLAIIMQNYGDVCMEALNDPEARLKYWVEIQ